MTFLPNATGYWSADPASKVSNGTGLSPFDGAAMLRFDETYWDCQAVAGSGSDLHQLVLSNPAVASYTLVARFNRVAAATDSLFVAALSAFAGDPSEFDDFSPGIPNVLASTRAEILSDNDPATWETISASLEIPAGTTYLSVSISAIENIANDACPVEFAGHYADGIGLFETGQSPAPVPSLQPLPLVALVLGITCLGWLGAARAFSPARRDDSARLGSTQA